MEINSPDLSKRYGLRSVWIRPYMQKWLLPNMFRWQWALFYEYADGVTGEWERCHEVFETRADARRFRGYMDNATCFRNWQLKRRRVQRNWEHYRNLRGWTDKDEL